MLDCLNVLKRDAEFYRSNIQTLKRFSNLKSWTRTTFTAKTQRKSKSVSRKDAKRTKEFKLLWSRFVCTDSVNVICNYEVLYGIQLRAHTRIPSFPRKRESSLSKAFWIPDRVRDDCNKDNLVLILVYNCCKHKYCLIHLKQPAES